METGTLHSAEVPAKPALLRHSRPRAAAVLLALLLHPAALPPERLHTL